MRESVFEKKSYLIPIEIDNFALTETHVNNCFCTLQKKRLSKPRQPIEMGTQNKGDVDYDWLPEGTLSEYFPAETF